MRMRDNYFAKMIKYAKIVCQIERGLSNLKDEIQNPTYKTDKVATIVLIAFLLRIESFNELNLMLKSGEFKKLFPKGTRLPGIDTIRDTLKVIGIEEIEHINQHIVRKAVENKVFANGTIDGLTVAAIDGISFLGAVRKNALNAKLAVAIISTTE